MSLVCVLPQAHSILGRRLSVLTVSRKFIVLYDYDPRQSYLTFKPLALVRAIGSENEMQASEIFFKNMFGLCN